MPSFVCARPRASITARLPWLGSRPTRGVACLLLLLIPLIAGCGGGNGSPGGGGTTDSGPPPTGTGPLIAQPNKDTRSTLTGANSSNPVAWTVFYPTKQLTPKKWTFLVYMNGANDLGAGGSGNFDIQNVLQMEKIGSSDNVNIVLQWEVEIGFWNSSAPPLWTARGVSGHLGLYRAPAHGGRP